MQTLYFPKHKQNAIVYEFMKKYLIEDKTLFFHNRIIEYTNTGIFKLNNDYIENTSVFYDNNYLNSKQKMNLKRQIEKLGDDVDQKLMNDLFSYTYILRNDCIHEFEDLSRDEQISNWLKIIAHLPLYVPSLINLKCSQLIKNKLEDMNKTMYTMNQGDNTSIFIRTSRYYKRGRSSNKMHICFNDELSYNVKLYFEVIQIFHDFYMEHMSHICYYKVIGGILLRDSKWKHIEAYNNFNRKMPNIAIYLEHVHEESQIIEYGERFRTYFYSRWKHKFVPFTKSQLPFNNSINKTLRVEEGKYFIQYTSGSSGNQKLDCIGEIMKYKTKCDSNDGKLTSPTKICKRNTYKIKDGIRIKKIGDHYRVDCEKSTKATKKECKQGKQNKTVGRIVNTKCIKNKSGQNEDICYDELCFQGK